MCRRKDAEEEEEEEEEEAPAKKQEPHTTMWGKRTHWKIERSCGFCFAESEQASQSLAPHVVPLLLPFPPYGWPRHGIQCRSGTSSRCNAMDPAATELGKVDLVVKGRTASQPATWINHCKSSQELESQPVANEKDQANGPPCREFSPKRAATESHIFSRNFEIPTNVHHSCPPLPLGILKSLPDLPRWKSSTLPTAKPQLVTSCGWQCTWESHGVRRWCIDPKHP